MMRTPWEISCPANTLRGQLKHSWLENGILCARPANVVGRRADGSFEREGKIAQYLNDIDVTRQLAEDLIQGFSPAQLVDQLGPLQKLPEETRLKIKEAVHDAYLDSSGMTELAESLGQEAEVFAKEFEKFSKVWNTGDDTDLKKAWQGVLQKAETLLAVFEKLPKGVVLP